MKRILLLAAACLALGCSPGAQETASGGVSGTLYDAAQNAYTFGTVAEADAVQQTGPSCAGGAQQQSQLTVSLSTRAGSCAAAQAGEGRASSTVLQLSIVGTAGTSGGAPPVLAPATYSIGSAISDLAGNLYDVSVTFARFDGACVQQDLFAASGSVTITSITSGEVQGSFTADFGDGSNSGQDGTLTGDFDSLGCAVAPAQLCAATASGGCAP